ncbi:hypothetical protein GCM10009753_79310 [Streptantibioticus ferralitis]
MELSVAPGTLAGKGDDPGDAAQGAVLARLDLVQLAALALRSEGRSVTVVRNRRRADSC